MTLLRITTVLSISLLVTIAAADRVVAADARSNGQLDVATIQRHCETIESFVGTYCLDCHSAGDPAAEFDLESFNFSPDQFSQRRFRSEPWEKILRRIHTRQMPPPDAERPSEDEYETAIGALAAALDDRAKAFPRPGRTSAIRRMTRWEYQNAIRDLLAIKVDVTDWLPQDESSHGFDNITVSELSPTLLSRYLTAAQQISRLAVGREGRGPMGRTVRVPADRTQETHVEGLPLGTRGGVLFSHVFPQDGEYEIELRLTRDRDEKVEGLNEPHDIDVLVDRRRVHRFGVKPPPDRQDYTHADTHLTARIQVTAGQHDVGVTFPEKSASLMESKRQPFDARYNRHRHPRITPALFQVSIVGPFDGRVGDTESRQAIFTCRPTEGEDPTTCAENVLRRLMRRAYRRGITEDDLESPLWFFKQGFEEGGFDAGIESALTSVLVNPNFLFRIEQQPRETRRGQPYPIDQFELASRLSYFLWSSTPDETLLDLAERGRLKDNGVLGQQVSRMLGDERSQSLVNNFAAQWLYLRNLDSITPDLRLFPDFDDNLRDAFRRETELMFGDIVENDRSVLDLIRSDHTHLNERLARHYGIPHVFGSHFRRVDLDPASHRGGLLRHGSILTVTSYATRTSPTIRGHWILKNILGTPPPPPPPNVPNLEEKTTLSTTSVRERLAQHRADPACASCHDLMDPVGFALEHFDAVGRWRQWDGTLAIDSQGSLPDGSEIAGVAELEAGILERPEVFVGTLSEKLMTFALGRGIRHDDGPAVRRVVRLAEENDFKFSAVIEGIVTSTPFQMRTAE